MTKKLLSILILFVLLVVFTTTAYAGGDKVRGENGQGSVSQHQVMLPPPFQP